jgi:hypothetical protein
MTEHSKSRDSITALVHRLLNPLGFAWFRRRPVEWFSRYALDTYVRGD